MRKLVPAALAGAALLAASVVGAPAASAAYNDGACQTVENCLFGKANYSGGLADIDIIDSNWANNYFHNGNNINDAVSSGFPIDRAAQYWQHAGFSGPHFILGVNQYDASWGTNQPNASHPAFNFNNQVSSAAIWVPPNL